MHTMHTICGSDKTKIRQNLGSYLSRHSTSTGLASIRRIEDGTAVKVKALERTSSPGLTPAVSRAIRIADEHELTPRAYLTPGPSPVAVKSTNSCSSWATSDVSALTALYLFNRPERSTSTTPAMLSSGTPMGSVKSLVKTGGACCCPTPVWEGFGKDVTMENALVEQGAAKHRTASIAAAFMFEACKAILLVVVKDGGLARRERREGRVIRGWGITCDGGNTRLGKAAENEPGCRRLFPFFFLPDGFILPDVHRGHVRIPPELYRRGLLELWFTNGYILLFKISTTRACGVIGRRARRGPWECVCKPIAHRGSD